MGRSTWSLWSVIVMALSVSFREISAWNNGSLVPSAAHTTLIETERKPSFFQELLPSTEPLSTVSFSMLSTTTDRLDKLSSASSTVTSSSSTTDKIDNKGSIAKSRAVFKTLLGNFSTSTDSSQRENFHVRSSTTSLWQIGISSSITEMFLQVPSSTDLISQSATALISTVFPHQITALAMSASMNIETTFSVHTKRPLKPSTGPELRRMLVARLTIETMKFTPELADISSEIFKELARDLELLLNDVFDEISGFLYVKVTSFENGSIVCNFMIYIKIESLAKAEEFERILTAAAAKGGKTGKYQISNIEVQDDQVQDDQVQDDVGEVKGKEPEGKSIPVKVIGVAAFVGVVALIIVFLLYKAVTRRRKEREGHTRTGDVYPLSDFSSPNTEVEERKAALRRTGSTYFEDIDEDGDEITPFYKPGSKSEN